MKLLLATLAPGLLVLPAAAQDPTAVTPLKAPPGKSVQIEFTNPLAVPISVSADGLWQRVYLGSDCNGPVVRFDPWITAGFMTLQPGDTAVDVWNQLDDQGLPLPPGTYSLDVLPGHPVIFFKFCVEVELTATPETSAYCTAGTSSSGCQATLSTTGVASASAPSGFTVSASGLDGRANGLFFFGTSGRQAAPWGNGTSFQCVVPPIRRGGTMIGQGTKGLCDGSYAQDLNALWCAGCPKPQANPGPGAAVQAQLWYRDPQSTSNQPTAFSDAVEFCVEP